MALDFDFDFAVSAPFRMQPGLRRVGTDRRQLTPCTLGAKPCDALAEKLGALAMHAGRALLRRQDFDAGPALARLNRELAQHYPDAWRVDADGHPTALHLGWTLIGEQLHAEVNAAPEIAQVIGGLLPEWRLAALMSLAFEEDFAIVDGRDATIPWMAVCLPSFWAPEAKAGRHFAEIHRPVADAERVVTASEHLMKLVCGPQRWERYVWTLTPHPALRAHPATTPRTPWSPHADADALAHSAYLRVERQTFIPLPDIEQAVFTIRVQRAPLATTIVSAEHARRLHDALATMSDAVLAYRGLTDARPRLLDWLARKAHDAPQPG